MPADRSVPGGTFPSFHGKGRGGRGEEAAARHEEMHSKVEYVVAHGISSYIDGKKVVIGSSHFVFEDEGCTVRPECRERFEALPEEYSHLYLAIEKELVAVICIEDPLREEAADMIRALRAEGVQKTVYDDRGQ